MTQPTSRGTAPSPRKESGWRVPVALLIITLVPVVTGTLRLVDIAGGPQLLPANPRLDASPVPLMVHVVGAVIYAVFGAFQFSARLRRRHLNWHRITGRILVGAGLAVALSGFWMTVFFPGALGGDLLWGIRLLVSTAMAAFIVLGFTAIRRRDIPAHRAWMIRAYALGLGPGTQVLTEGLGQTLFGITDLSKALALGLGWAINAAVGEWIVRRPAVRRARRASRAGRIRATVAS